MKTVTIQIGNSDNKLTQAEWSLYARGVHNVIKKQAANIYFHGFSTGDAPWQNAAWVFDIEDDAELKRKLKNGREFFQQDAIAWTEGITTFV